MVVSTASSIPSVPAAQTRPVTVALRDIVASASVLAATDTEASTPAVNESFQPNSSDLLSCLAASSVDSELSVLATPTV